jgi:vitamin B12 transporter
MKMKLKPLAPFIVACALLLAVAQAALGDPSPSPTPAPTATPLALGTIIVTAERYPTTLHGTPRDAYVLSGAEMMRLGALTVADGLRLMPGVSVIDYGTAGHLQTALLRGATSTETLVLINGRPANEPGVGLFDFSSLPASAVDRVEIVGGAASSLYGSAAMGGVIDIITRDAAGRGGSASATVGYQGALSTAVDVAVNPSGNGSGARIDYASHHARDAFSYPPALGAPAGALSNNDANGQDVFLSLANADSAPIRLRAHFSDDTSDDGEPGSLLFGGQSLLARQQRDFTRGDVSAERTFDRADVSAQVYSDGQRIHFYDGTSDPNNFIFPFDTLSHFTTRGFALRDTVKSDFNTFSIGYDSRADVAQFDETFGGTPSSAPGRAATTGVYVSDEMSGRSPWIVTGGLREERPQGFARTSVPSVGVMYRSPNGDVGARANYGRAFRIPALEETSPLFFGNPALAPEYAATFDVGIFDRDDSLTYFGMRASNLIVSEPPAFVPENVSLASVRGVNVSVGAALQPGYRAQVSYTDYLRATDVRSGDRLPLRPTATGSLRLSRTSRSWDSGATLDFVGQRFGNIPNTIVLPGYATVGAYVRHGVGLSSVTLRLTNVTGARVEGYPGYPVLGPTLSLTVSTAWLR